MTIASIRARARAILKRAGIEYAHSYPSRIRGCRNWTGGVTIDKPWLDGLASITPRYDRREVRDRDLAAAISALRAAGWTVDDDGTIRGVPDAG